MNQLDFHNASLIRFFNKLEWELDVDKLDKILSLDYIDNIVRDNLSIDEMRTAGTFFTGQALSSLMKSKFNKKINDYSVVLDPTCGAGNLLIECTKNFRIKEGLHATLLEWGKKIHGYDLNNSFVITTKLRIILEAINRGAKKDCEIGEAISCLVGISTRDVMSVKAEELKEITHVVMNPPFSSWESPKENYWMNGKTNAAGIIFDNLIKILPSNCLISAILPDVLRSGSRYHLWRQQVESKLLGDCLLFGRFDSKTDIDIFILSGEIAYREGNIISWFPNKIEGDIISDYFTVCVGPLVAYRDPKIGDKHPYLHTKNAKKWEVINEINEFRNFSGRVISPPFVVIRRTSSPSDQFRAVSTVINSGHPVAVENHLLVAIPNSKKLSDCEKLMGILSTSQTNDYLNNRIRCRHLTVGIIKDIPYR